MALLGLSILVASVSFLCYRHPPTSWSFFTWLRPSPQQSRSKKTLRSVNTQRHHEDEKRNDVPLTTQSEALVAEKNAAIDRIAMPPPPPLFKTNTTKSMLPPPTPSFTLHNGNEDDDEPRAPSFPAANSAQRASGSTGRAVPLFPAANSAQRASTPARDQPLRNPNSPATGFMAPPPARGPLPNRGQSSKTSSSLSVPPTHNAIPTKPKRKVLLTPGHSPLDWARLTSSNANLRGLPPSTPYLRVPPSLLKQYTGRKGKDAWTILGGKVYNMTPYLPYHPGGEPELLKAAGRDGTKLFGEVHPWVNWEGMLEGCMIGVAVSEDDMRVTNQLEEMD